MTPYLQEGILGIGTVENPSFLSRPSAFDLSGHLHHGADEMIAMNTSRRYVLVFE